jgi:uncharacterized membrane protein YkvA (DUF1232 family)
MLGILIGLASVVLVGWAVLAIAVARARPDDGVAGGALRLLPDTLRLLRNLAGDRTLPRSVRWRLAIALVYNIQPINLVPDFIPVIGVVDNLVVTAWALRSALKTAGPDAVARHWTGTDQGLRVVCRLVGLTPASKARS